MFSCRTLLRSTRLADDRRFLFETAYHVMTGRAVAVVARIVVAIPVTIYRVDHDNASQTSFAAHSSPEVFF